MPYNETMNAPAIEATHIKHDFAHVTALDDVTISIRHGAVFGLLGPNGAGKTTMVRVLNGIITPTSAGSITILGLDLTTNIQDIRQRVGVQTDTNLYERLTALDNLRLFGELYGMSNEKAIERSKILLEQFELTDRTKAKIETFSKGMRQKVSIARALVSDPELVYLDEPTAGLDPEASFELLQYIKSVSSDSSKTFFIASHRLEEMEATCDIVAVLNKGNIQAVGAPHELARKVFTDIWVNVRLSGDGAQLDAAFLKDNMPFVLESERANGEIRFKVASKESIPELIRRLAKLDVDIYGIFEDEPTLQDAYLALVKETK
ncbi:MAG TPA: ABC transporter ATP-binding protein [Candidatus Aquicultor sp.]|jgi:ABC-2 type transport system ATP-binding protein